MASGSGAHARVRHRLVIELALERLLEHLDRHLDQHRAALAGAHGVIGAAEQVRQLGGRMGHGGPFGDRAERLGGAEGRPLVLPLERIAGRNHQQRHILAEGLGDAGKGILDAGALLDGEHAVLLAAADAREAVGDADADALLAAQDGADIELGAGVDHRITRIAGEEFRPLALEDLGDDVGTIHFFSFLWLRGRRTWARLVRRWRARRRARALFQPTRAPAAIARQRPAP